MVSGPSYCRLNKTARSAHIRAIKRNAPNSIIPAEALIWIGHMGCRASRSIHVWSKTCEISPARPTTDLQHACVQSSTCHGCLCLPHQLSVLHVFLHCFLLFHLHRSQCLHLQHHKIATNTTLMIAVAAMTCPDPFYGSPGPASLC